jgi:succinyldiaminopimelate transaminase
MTAVVAGGFVPPPYPYDRLDELKVTAVERHGACVDLSIGTPYDPPPAPVLEALSGSGSERGYPPSIGTEQLRTSAARWYRDRLGVTLAPENIAACVGTKEFVAGLPQWLRLRRPDKDTVLYPAISYPTYAMGAQLAGCRAVPVPLDDQWRLDLARIDHTDAARALCLWVNTPGNPTGGLDDLEAIAAWGQSRDVPVFSDECYVEYTWDGPPRTILSSDTGEVVALHSLSKRSNLAGVRVGFYAGDPDLVRYLREVRKHAGFIVPGPCQAAGAAALDDDAHVDEQRERYRERLVAAQQLMAAAGVDAPLPGGAFYLWAPAPDGDAWALARRLARDAGVLVSPGEFYGDAGAGYVRVAAVRPAADILAAADRLRGGAGRATMGA